MPFNAMEYLQYFGYERIKDHNELNVMASCHNDEMHSQGDMKRSFGIRKDTGVANCYVCGGWSLEQLTAELLNRNAKDGEHFSEYDALKFLEMKEWLPEEESIEDISKKFKSMGSLEEEFRPKLVDIKKYTMEDIEPYLTSMHKRTFKRGETDMAIDVETARRFYLGYDKQTKRIVVPVFNAQADVIGVISRATRDDDMIRYGVGTVNPTWYLSQIQNTFFDGDKMLLVFDKRHYIYGEHTWYNIDGTLKFDTLLILESPLDVVYAHAQGLHEFMNIGAIFGSKCTREQLLKAIQHKNVVEGFDNDKPGIEGREKFHKDAIGKTQLFTFDSFGKKDLGDCTPDEVKSSMGRFKPYANKLFGHLQPILE